MSFLYLFLSGILIGTAMVVPGLSGGVIAVILGIYDKMINSLNNLFKDFKNSFMFLIVLTFGVLIGAIWFSNVIIFLYQSHAVVTKLCFIGLILGGVPYLFKDIKKRGYKVDYVLMLSVFLISFILWFVSNKYLNINFSASSNSLFINILLLFISGFIYSVGKIVPGISGSFLLIMIGMYEFVLSAMAHPFTYGLSNLDKVFPFLIGLLIGVIILLKIMNYLLDRHYDKVYSTIIGFVLGSLPGLIPFDGRLSSYFIGFILLVLSFVLSYRLTKGE